jgi:MFS family permease
MSDETAIENWNSNSAFRKALSAAAFALSSQNTNFEILAVLHFCGGLATGMALSVAHGTIGNTANPHRTFAYAGLALGIFGIIFSGAAPVIVAMYGGASLLVIFMVIMGTAAVVALAIEHLLAFMREELDVDLRRNRNRPHPASAGRIRSGIRCGPRGERLRKG